MTFVLGVEALVLDHLQHLHFKLSERIFRFIVLKITGYSSTEEKKKDPKKVEWFGEVRKTVVEEPRRVDAMIEDFVHPSLDSLYYIIIHPVLKLAGSLSGRPILLRKQSPKAGEQGLF